MTRVFRSLSGEKDCGVIAEGVKKAKMDFVTYSVVGQYQIFPLYSLWLQIVVEESVRIWRNSISIPNTNS